MCWKLESALARMVHLEGKWLEWRLGQVRKDTESPVEEIGTSDSRGTITALKAANVLGEGAWQWQAEKKLGRDTRGSEYGQLRSRD